MFFYSIIRKISSSSQAEDGTTVIKRNKTQFSKFSLIARENFEKQLNKFFFFPPTKHFLLGKKKITFKSRCFTKLTRSRTTASSLQTSNTENLKGLIHLPGKAWSIWTISRTKELLDTFQWGKTDTGNALPTTTVMMDSSLQRSHRLHRHWFWKTKKISAQQFYQNITNSNRWFWWKKSKQGYSLILYSTKYLQLKQLSYFPILNGCN